MTEPRTLPRFADMVVSDKPARMSRRRRALVTQDGTLIARDEAMLASCMGEPLPIAGEAITMDARPRSDLRAVTFDGALPSTTDGDGR